MADIFDEVSEDLRAERAQRLFRQYGWLIAVVAALLVVGVGGWQAWRWKQGQERAAVATSFLTAMQQAGGPGDASATASQTFADIAANGPAGYRTLARLREAAIKASAGDLPAASALWDQVSADENADPQLRQVADLLWVQHQIDKGDPALVEGRLQPLLAPSNPWRPLALESQAWLKLRTGDKAGAADSLRQILAMPSVPEGVRARATGLLTRIDPTGATIEGGKQG